jgi:hypothetical protein
MDKAKTRILRFTTTKIAKFSMVKYDVVFHNIAPSHYGLITFCNTFLNHKILPSKTLLNHLQHKLY